MSYLIIGSNYNAIKIAEILSKHKFKINIITESYNNKKDLMYISQKNFEKLFYDENGIIKEINEVIIVDTFDNKTKKDTNTYLIDLNYYRNKILKNNNFKIIDNAKIIDKNEENIFVQTNGKGTLLKNKFVIDYEREGKDITEIKAIVKGNLKPHDLVISFTDFGYISLTNLIKDKFYLVLKSTNANFEFNNFIKKYKLNIISKKEKKLNLFENRKLNEREFIYPTENKGLINNLTFSGKLEEIVLTQKLDEFLIEQLHTKTDLEKYINKYFPYLYDNTKLAKIFWNVNNEKKNKYILNLDTYKYAFNFKSMFNKLSFTDRIKLFLG